MNTSIHRTREVFERLKKDNTFVVYEKHGGALRNSYGTSVPEAIPDVVLGDTLSWSQQQPDQVYVTEAYNPRRGEATSADVHKMLEDGASHINRIGKRAVIYSWFNTPQTKLLADSLDVHPILVSRDEAACSHIEDKSLLQTHLSMAGCTDALTPRHVTVAAASELPDFQSTATLFGEKFVLQGMSMGGDGTVIVSGKESYDAARYKLKGNIRVSEFVDAPYSSVYCLSIPNTDKSDVAVFVDGPSHKPVDISALGIGNTAGAGGDWCSSHEPFDAKQLTSDISRLAAYFYHTKAYYGHFVVEGFVRNGKFIFNEINARPGGGSEVNSLYQVEQGLPSFTTAHILGRLGLLSAEQMPAPDEYSHYAIDRALNGRLAGAFYLKYKNSSHSKVITTDAYAGSGVYAFDGSGGVKKTSDGIVSTTAHVAASKVLISNGPVAGENASVASGKQVCTIEGRLEGQRQLVDRDNQLRPDLKLIVDNLTKLFKPE